MATLAEVFAKYNRGVGGDVLGSLRAEAQRFGLSEEELARGLEAAGQWHVMRFGQGYTPYSASAAIVNGAIQNALNARADASYYERGAKAWEGGAPVAGALGFADSPERIAAHRATEQEGIANHARDQGAWSTIYEYTAPQYWGKPFDPGQEQNALTKLATDAGISIGQLADVAKRMPYETAMWFGPQARYQWFAEQLGLDPKKYVNEAQRTAEQNQVAQLGQAAQGNHGDNLLQKFVVGAGAMALGFAALAGVGGSAAGSLAEVGAQAAAAGDAGFLTAGGVATPATGGSFVGSGGLLGGTGNAIADAALNGVVRGGVTSALTGGDPVTGMISGGVSGGIGSMLPDLGSPALNNAAQGAVSGGVGAAVNGGDILTGAAAGGAASGVGTLVREAVPADIGGNALTSAAAGGAAGAVGSAIAGGDVGTGLIRGAVTGGTTGALTDAGADPLVAGAAGTAAGGLITAPTPDAGTPAAQQQQTATTIGAGLGFSVVLPQFQDVRRRDMQWGSRLSGG